MADYKIKHVGLNSAILTSDNELDNGFIAGTNYGILEQIARWEFNTPNEIEFRPVKPY